VISEASKNLYNEHTRMYFQKNDIKIFLILFFIAFIISLESPLSPFAKNIPWTDSSVFIYIAKCIMNGDVVYRDTFDHKGPFLYVINFLGLSLTEGKSFYGIWLFQLISLLTTALFLFKTASLFYNRIISILVVFLLLVLQSSLDVGGNIAESWALPFISISLFYFTRYFRSGRKFSIIELVIISISFTLTFLLRPNLVLFWGIFGLSVITDMIISKRFIEFIKYSLVVIISVLVTILPFFLYFYMNSSLNEAWYGVLEFNLKYTSSLDPESIKMLLIGFFRLTFVIVGIAIFTVITIFRLYRGKYVFLEVTILITFMLSLLSCFMGRPSLHYLVQIIPLLTIPLGVSINYLYDNLLMKKTIITIIVVLSVAMPSLITSLKTLVKNYYTYDTYAFNYSVVGEIKKYSDEHDKILVFGNSNNYYLCSGRMSSSKYSFCYPVIEKDKKIEDEYFLELERNKPKVIIADLFWNSFNKRIREKFETRIRVNYDRIEKEFDNAIIWIRKDNTEKVN
jgi:hypothetical protein